MADTGDYPPGEAGTGVAAWAVTGVATVALAGVVAAIAVWFAGLGAPAAQAPPVADAGPAAGTSGNGATSGSGTGSSPLGRVDQAWAAKAAAATGMSLRAFLAYASADLTIEKERPGCGLGWNTLAAIGTVESGNGTYGGATVRADGYTSKPIIGVPLDGGTVAAIPDTDHGRLDGDARWDHAVGPLQFVPATWARWGTDGNGDGVASPGQIDDAAVTAARYLCASGPMTSAAGWRAAVYSYNHSDAYVDEVAGIANRYAADVSRRS